jgi:hypothetical protein
MGQATQQGGTVKRLSILIVTAVFVFGCADNSTRLVPASDKSVALVLVPADDPLAKLQAELPKKVVIVKTDPVTKNVSFDFPDLRERKVWETCGYKFKENETSDKLAFVPLLVGLAVDYLIKGISNAVNADIQKYNASFSAAVTDHFYKQDSNPPAGNWSCLRFIRYAIKNEQTGDREVVFDLVSLIRRQSDYIQIIPLRLYYGATAIKAKDVKKVSVGVTVSASSIWQERNQGKSGSLFSSTLLTLTCELSNAPVVWYAASMGKETLPKPPCASHSKSPSTADEGGLSSETSGILSPLPPFSIALDGKPSGAGIIQLTATAAEVASPPKVLCALAGALTSQKSSLESALTSAIDEKLGAESSATSSKNAAKPAEGSAGSTGSGDKNGDTAKNSSSSTNGCGSQGKETNTGTTAS